MLVNWIESHPGTAAWVQAVGAIVAVAIAIAIPWWQQRLTRRDDQRAKATELAGLRLALHTEVGMVGHQCLLLGDLLMGGGDPSQKNLRSTRLPPLTIFQANAGKIGLLTRDEIVHLIAFSGELFDMSNLANDLMERKMAGRGIIEDFELLKLMRVRACRHAAEFLATVPGIPGADKDQAHIANLRKAAAGR